MSDSERAPNAAGRPGRSAGTGRAILRVAAALLGLGAAAVAALLIAVGIALAMAYPNLPEIAGLTDYRPKLPLRVISADGTLLGEFGEERRIYTPIAQIPKVMQEAVLAIEDARFYQHGGVDTIGVIRAAFAQFNRDRKSTRLN